MKATMIHPLTPRAIALHEAARLLFLDFLLALPATERVRVESNMRRGRLRVDISLLINEACVDFVNEAPEDGSRGLLGSITVPVPAHEPDCDCVACEPARVLD